MRRVGAEKEREREGGGGGGERMYSDNGIITRCPTYSFQNEFPLILMCRAMRI